jgi:hypothetical protein
MIVALWAAPEVAENTTVAGYRVLALAVEPIVSAKCNSTLNAEVGTESTRTLTAAAIALPSTRLAMLSAMLTSLQQRVWMLRAVCRTERRGISVPSGDCVAQYKV